LLRPFSALLAAVLAAPSPAFSAVLKLRAGGEEPAASVTVDATGVHLPGGRILPRSAVEEIRFAEAAPVKAAAAAADPEAAARGRELFQEADALEKQYPGVDGLTLVSDGDFELRPDGGQVEIDRFAGKILKDGLKNSWGQVSRSFEDGRSRVRILKATVYEPDGRVFPLDASKIQVSRPQAEELFFQEERVVTYPMPQVEVGSIVEYEVETETYNPFRKDFFFPEWGFQDWTPVRESTLRIALPAGRPLYYSTTNFDGPWARAAKPKVETKDGRTAYQWSLAGLPPIVSEPRMVQYADISPFVKASLFAKWDRIYDWLGAMYKARTNPSPELAAFTRQLVKGLPDDDARVAAIYRYVQKHVRYIAVKMGVASGWGGYDANLTWKRRYGCCIDKALLLTTMLKVIGVPSTPVLLDTNYSAVHDIRVPDIGFEHAITHLTLDGRGMFLDSVGEDFRFPQIPSMDHGVNVLDVFDRKFLPLPTPKPRNNASRYQYDLALSTDGAAAMTFSAGYNGTREGELRGYYKTLKASELQKDFQDQAEAVSPSAVLTAYHADNAEDLSKPFLLGWSARLPDYLIRAGDLYILKLPGLEDEYPEVALSERRYALKYETSFERVYRYDVTLPPGFRAASVPAKVKLKGPGESFALDCRAAGSRLTCDADVQRAQRVYSAREYAAHKAFLDKVARLTKDRVFLRRDGA
jgi:transglutaminase-like putative cysteine protease